MPELTLSGLSSAVGGVFRSSVDVGSATARALPSSSSIALHGDSSCLGFALLGFHMLGHLLSTTVAGGWLAVNLILQKGSMFKEG